MKKENTPIEIFEYKRAWRPRSTSVKVHSGIDCKCKDWCRKHLERHQWTMDAFTDIYEHTFLFEHKHDAEKFANEWTKIGK